MGKMSSKYQSTKTMMKEMTKEFHLQSDTAVRKWYASFMKSYPSGRIDEAEFVSIYQKFFPKGEVQDFARHVFRAFGGKENGGIGFKEFYRAFIVQSQGDLNEKINFAFRMYDLDGNGQITKDEMLTIIRSIYKLLGTSVRMPEHINTPEKRTEILFNQMDINKEGNISYETFLESARLNSYICKILGGSLENLLPSSPTSSQKSVN